MFYPLNYETLFNTHLSPKPLQKRLFFVICIDARNPTLNGV